MDGGYDRPRQRRRRRPFLVGLVTGVVLSGLGFGGYILANQLSAPAHVPEFLAATPTAIEAPAPAPPVTGGPPAKNLSKQANVVPTPPGFAPLVKKVKPAVVTVRVKLAPQADTGGYGRGAGGLPGLPGMGGGPPSGHVVLGLGSGFFVSSDGYIVTNNHVVAGADTVHVVTDSGHTLVAKVIGTDPDTDLALIKVPGGPYPFLTLAQVGPQVGDWVLAIGNPFGLGGTVTAGIVSARGRDIADNTYDRYIQIDAPVNKGNSGGPAVGMNGQVIGVNSAIYSPNGGSVGIAFDIPASTVKRVIVQLLEHGHVLRGWLGVEVQTLTPDLASSLGLEPTKGALIAAVDPQSPAGKAGLRPGDVVTQVNGAPVENSRDFVRSLAALKPGTQVKLTLLHGGAQRQATVELGPRPPDMAARFHPPTVGSGP